MELTPIYFITFFLIIVAIGIVMLVLVYQRKQMQYLNEKEQMKATFEKEILESKLEIQEQTMKNISQEIHDNIGQVLSVVKLNINRMNSSDTNIALQEKIETTSGLVGKAIQDLRDLSKSLDSDIIAAKGLVKAIESEFTILKKTGAYTTELIIEDEGCTLPDQKELIVFRIFQEAMHNIIKHAQASHVKVKVCFHPNKLLLQIDDDGQGFDMRQDKNYGAGLTNMHNRSRLLGASCNIHSKPGKGTTVLIELPVS